MVRFLWRAVPAGSFLFLSLTLPGPTPARAQAAMTGQNRSLGGYGGAMTDVGTGMGMGGPAIPYAGKFGGFMPYRMGGNTSLSFPARGASSPGTGRASFNLSPMSGGMPPLSGGVRPGMGAGGLMSTSPGSQGGTGFGTMPGSRGMGVMPPSFGYPFRQPPSLLTPSSAGAGMSM